MLLLLYFKPPPVGAYRLLHTSNGSVENRIPPPRAMLYSLKRGLAARNPPSIGPLCYWDGQIAGPETGKARNRLMVQARVTQEEQVI